MNDKRLFLISIGAGLVAVVATLVYANRVRPDGVSVLVAKRTIDAGERFGDDNVEPIEVEIASADVLREEDLVVLKSNAGAHARRAIAAGQLVLAGDVEVGNEARLSSTIAPGKRALALPVTRATSVANLVRPGDQVEILVARKRSALASAVGDPRNPAQTQDLSKVEQVPGSFEVLAVGGQFGSAARNRAPETYDTVTLQVDEKEALSIVELINKSGSWDGITLLLCSSQKAASK